MLYQKHYKMETRIKGAIYIVFSLLFFIYYTLWVIGLPFLDEEYAPLIHKFFPPVELALGIPCLVFGILFAFLLGQAYLMVCRDRKLYNKSL